MINAELECALTLLRDEYQEMTSEDNPWEMAYLREEAEKGMAELIKACQALFGNQLPAVLNRAIANAQALAEQAQELANAPQPDEMRIALALTAQDWRGAAKTLHLVQQKLTIFSAQDYNRK